MRNNYLIPANGKRSLQYFGMFSLFDLILVGSGTVVTFILIMLGDVSNLIWSTISLLPFGITAFLVFPLGVYHNCLTFFKSLWNYLTERKCFIWKGWCVTDEKE